MPAPKKYNDELRERATRLALEARRDPASAVGAIRRIGDQLGIHPEALRVWVLTFRGQGLGMVVRVGEARGGEESVGEGGPVLHPFEPVAGDAGQVVGPAGGEVGHAAFQARPDVLGRVQLRGVAG
jgi:hypothetical protein